MPRRRRYGATVRRLVARVPARGALVFVGVALSVLGLPRVLPSFEASTTADTAVAAAGVAAATDHAVVERPAASIVGDWSKFISDARAALIAAVVLVVIAAIADLDRVVLAMVGVPWRRRGPPTQRA
jgi:hypothetical protein